MIPRIPVRFRTFTRKSVIDRARCLIACVLIGTLVGGQSLAETPNHFLIALSPGSSWNEAISYEEQPGLREHHNYVRQLHLSDQLVMSGPVTDINDPFVALLLVRTGSREEAEQIAQRDPAVETRILRAMIIPWYVQASSLRFIRQKSSPSVNDGDQSFSIRRYDPDSRLNLEQPESRD